MSSKAILYRMVLPDHVCPYGVSALQLLERHGFEVDDRILATRMQVDVFKADHDVDTTPQTFIERRRIGGFSELEEFLAEEPAEASI